jgi:hypothetical protein
MVTYSNVDVFAEPTNDALARVVRASAECGAKLMEFRRVPTWGGIFINAIVPEDRVDAFKAALVSPPRIRAPRPRRSKCDACTRGVANA